MLIGAQPRRMDRPQRFLLGSRSLRKSVTGPQASACRYCAGPVKSRRQIGPPGLAQAPNRQFSGLEPGFSGRNGRSGEARTPNPRFWRPVLYQLSYTPTRPLLYPAKSPASSPFIARSAKSRVPLLSSCGSQATNALRSGQAGLPCPPARLSSLSSCGRGSRKAKSRGEGSPRLICFPSPRSYSKHHRVIFTLLTAPGF